LPLVPSSSLPIAGPEPSMVQGRQAQTIEINNPPLSPFIKGGITYLLPLLKSVRLETEGGGEGL